jgi:parvulin-like peptidyl-prolyl isomerase
LVTEVLTYLIQSVWMQGEATDRGVAVTPAQVATSFQQERKAATPPLTTVAELNSFLAKSGETVADLKWRTDITLLASKIEAKVQAATPAVTSTQIAAYYRAHRAQYVTPVTRNLHLVVTSTLVAANAAKAALAGGSSYAVVAPKYSIDPTSKAAGGKVLGASATALNPPLSAAVFKATPGILSGPLKAGSVYYVFTVDAIIPSSQQSLASASAAVKTLLTQQQTAKAGSTLQSDFTAKWAPRTNCRIGFVVSGAPASTGGAATPVCSKAAISTAVLADTANIVPPPSAAQTLIYTAPTGTTAPTGPTAPTATTTVPAAPAVSTPTSGPLSTEPKITVPKAPAPTTLVKTDLIVGSGAAVAAGDSITVNYVGALYSTGKVFDASWLRHQTFATTIGTGAVIKGWDQGLVGMRVGGRRELIIPSALAYGATVQGAVPANSTLIFIVDLLAVTPGG